MKTQACQFLIRLHMHHALVAMRYCSRWEIGTGVGKRHPGLVLVLYRVTGAKKQMFYLTPR
jgi:hypothetical protein